MNGNHPTMMHVNTSKDLAYTITTGLAGALNLLVIFVICFSLMPRVDRNIQEVEKTRTITAEIQRTLNENQRELEEHRKVIKRLNDALDAAAAKAKKAKGE